MKRISHLLLAGVALGVLAAAVWLYGTSSGREWRLSRADTADLLALTLSHPDDLQAHRVLGARLMAERRFAEAATAFAAAAAAEPKAAWPLVMQGRALIEAGNLGDAQAPLEEAVRREPDSDDALAALGEVYYALGGRVQAEEKFRAALKRDPADARAWAGLAYVLADSHQLSEARQDALKAAQIAPDSSPAYTAQGYVENEAGNGREAVEALTRAVALDASNGRAWGLLASARTRTARTPEEFAAAADALTKADALLPGSPLVPYYCGLLLAAQRKHATAADEFRRALQRSPNFTDALYNLSVSLAFAGRTAESAEARSRFERAHAYDRDVTNLELRIKRDPMNVDLWRRMKRLADAHGDIANARLARQRLESLAHGPSSPLVPR